jgi:hypothetical protein
MHARRKPGKPRTATARTTTASGVRALRFQAGQFKALDPQLRNGAGKSDGLCRLSSQILA